MEILVLGKSEKMLNLSYDVIDARVKVRIDGHHLGPFRYVGAQFISVRLGYVAVPKTNLLG